MGEIFLGRRKAADFEVPALERARQRDLERDMQVLAGLLSAEPAEHAPRPVTDIVWEFS